MRTFTKWLEDHKLELPTFSDVEQNSGKDISEKASKNFGFSIPNGIVLLSGQLIYGLISSNFSSIADIP